MCSPNGGIAAAVLVVRSNGDGGAIDRFFSAFLLSVASCQLYWVNFWLPFCG